jgi:tRNA pseudouridine13 synthase
MSSASEPSNQPPLPVSALPYLTADLPGIGGKLKQRPEEFVVEEIPAYVPSGEGEHLFLWVEKTDVAGEDLLRHIATQLAISPRDIGTAGVKDRRAITRQFVSVPAACEPAIGRIDNDRVRVLSSARHKNKLRTGHLRANRFSILVCDVTPDAADRAGRIAEKIERLGCPNYFGDQRFGHEGATLRTGCDLLRGQLRPQAIPFSRRRFLLRMSLSSVQSAVFNDVLAERLRDGDLHRVFQGDVMQVAQTGGRFVVADVAAEQSRFDVRETVLTGPIFGSDMLAPQGEPAEREERSLARWEFSLSDFARFPKFTSGTRRPLLAWPEDLRIESETDGLRLQFQLPSGVYATVLLREFMKVDQ